MPPTVQVTTRYPGASAQTVVDTVALPIELQVNGVPGMLYMQSTSAYDGTYMLTVTFEIGTDPNMDQVLVQNRVQQRAGPAAAGGAGAGRRDPREIPVDPGIRHAVVARTASTTRSICGITRRSTWSTSWRACRASATSW